MVQIKHFITVILGVAAIAPVVARPLIDNGKLEDANGRVGAEITRGRKQNIQVRVHGQPETYNSEQHVHQLKFSPDTSVSPTTPADNFRYSIMPMPPPAAGSHLVPKAPNHKPEGEQKAALPKPRVEWLPGGQLKSSTAPPEVTRHNAGESHTAGTKK